MNWLHIAFILAAAYLAVFFEASFSFPRSWIGVQIDLLPALMVYTALTNNILVISLLALVGGLSFDALSANPLGVSVLPLFAVGFVIDQAREYLVRESIYAQFILGAAASAAQPLLTVFFMLNLGTAPMVGWSFLWQLFLLTLGGAVATPILFALFDRIHRAFDYQPAHQSSFRPDREIKRGRL
jgi:rod shape-determining protein MreD